MVYFKCISISVNGVFLLVFIFRISLGLFEIGLFELGLFDLGLFDLISCARISVWRVLRVGVYIAYTRLVGIEVLTVTSVCRRVCTFCFVYFMVVFSNCMLYFLCCICI